MELNRIYLGNSFDVLKTFEDDSINCCVTSPPYFGLRDYGIDGQIGIEDTPTDYIERLVDVFDDFRHFQLGRGNDNLVLGILQLDILVEVDDDAPGLYESGILFG